VRALRLQGSHPIVQSDDAHIEKADLVIAAHVTLLIDVEVEGVVQVGYAPDAEAIA
jgi:hypothetical protein